MLAKAVINAVIAAVIVKIKRTEVVAFMSESPFLLLDDSTSRDSSVRQRSLRAVAVKGFTATEPK